MPSFATPGPSVLKWNPSRTDHRRAVARSRTPRWIESCRTTRVLNVRPPAPAVTVRTAICGTAEPRKTGVIDRQPPVRPVVIPRTVSEPTVYTKSQKERDRSPGPVIRPPRPAPVEKSAPRYDPAPVRVPRSEPTRSSPPKSDPSPVKQAPTPPPVKQAPRSEPKQESRPKPADSKPAKEADR